MARVCFLDNDITHKLVALQLFDPAMSSLQITKADLRVLPTAKFFFRKQRKQQILYSDDIWASIIALVESCAPVTDPLLEGLEESLVEAKQLENFKEEIQEGEASLILATRHEPDFLLLTGDKRCIAALPKIPTPIHDRLCGRIICLEQIVLKLINELGFEAMQERVFPATDCDKTLKICFGYSGEAAETEVRFGLNSYINDLHQQAPGLLAELF